jgi:hypothetical protein
VADPEAHNKIWFYNVLLYSYPTTDYGSLPCIYHL